MLLVDRIDRLVEAFSIASRTRSIAASSAGIGISLSLLAMVAAALGYLPPLAGALTQEAIDIAVVVNAFPAEAARDELVKLDALLREQVVPHERKDDAALYPRLGRLIGSDDPLGAMSRGHREIFSLVQALARQIGELPLQGPDASALHELQRLIYGLEAVLRLHCGRNLSRPVGCPCSGAASHQISSGPEYFWRPAKLLTRINNPSREPG